MTNTPVTYNSKVNLNIASIPPVEIKDKDPILYQELLDLHSAIENLLEGVKMQELTTTAFGDLKAEAATPITQISAEYGLLGQVLTVTDSAASGTNTTADSKFVCQTGGGSLVGHCEAAICEARIKLGQSV